MTTAGKVYFKSLFLLSLKGNVGCNIIADLRRVIAKYEVKVDQEEIGDDVIDKPFPGDMSYEIMSPQPLPPLSLFTAKSIEISSPSSSSFIPSLQISSPPNSAAASTFSTPKSKSSITFNIDSIETMEDYQTFFQPDKNKITLVDGHSLYIDVTQLQAIKNRSKKNPSRIVRELLSYNFTPEYLGNHSATGSKSTKKGLPPAIIDPIRGILTVQFCGFFFHNQSFF
ncbi:unnamed protein product [Mytilus coruscus]|uniref:Uncharacterized protein n=1 Tax=Mytilus coruscus TaxID=42192 RepID=A0A6J7ZU10_MYTCO|nr:unnamed protein product [Mytilus coruscus]